MLILIDIFLWVLCAVLMVIAAMRSRAVLFACTREGVVDYLKLVPRIFIGVVGSGYLAEALPQDVVGAWLGPDSGVMGVGLAVLGGAFTPGGPVVGFSIGAAALKGGANAAGDRLRDRMGAVRVAAAIYLGNAGDAAAPRLAARCRLAAAAVSGGGGRDAARKAVNPRVVQTLTFSSSSTRWVAGRLTMRSLNAV